MEVTLKLDEKPDWNHEDVMNNKLVTVTGEVMTMHFNDGAIEKVFKEAEKYLQIREIIYNKSLDEYEKVDDIQKLIEK